MGIRRISHLQRAGLELWERETERERVRTRGSWARLFRCLSVSESSVWQCVAVCCRELHRSVLHLFSCVSVCVAVCCSMLQYVAVCCIAVCCSYSVVCLCTGERARARKRGCVRAGIEGWERERKSGSTKERLFQTERERERKKGVKKERLLGEVIQSCACVWEQCVAAYCSVLHRCVLQCVAVVCLYMRERARARKRGWGREETYCVWAFGCVYVRACVLIYTCTNSGKIMFISLICTKVCMIYFL